MKKKQYRKIATFVLVALVVAVLCAPNVAIRFMKSDFASRLSDETGLNVEIGSLSAGWFSSVVVSDLSASTLSGERVFQCEQIRTQKSLVGLMFREKEVGEIRIESPNVRVPLEGSMKDELESALEQIDIEKGLLKELINPDRDTLAKLIVSNGEVQLRTDDQGSWHETIQGLNAKAEIERTSLNKGISLTVDSTPIELTPELGNFGLKFVAPVVDGAVELEGTGAFEITHCQIDSNNSEATELDGRLQINGAYADIKAELLLALSNLILRGEDAQSSSEPMALRFAKDCDIAVQLRDGKIHHEGVRFALTDYLPNTTLNSEGTVGLDQTLDFTISLEVPFEHMGEGELLQKIGSPSIAIPVSGTFKEPVVDIGKGKAIGNFVQSAVSSATDGQLDVTPILENIGELGLLRGRLLKGSADEERPTDESDKDSEPEETDGPKKPRRRLLNRIRNRKGD